MAGRHGDARAARDPLRRPVELGQHEQGQRIAADSPANYLRLYSQSTDPAGLTGYAIKRGSNPRVPAATGENLTLAAALGGYKNQNTTGVSRVLTLEALNPLPAGASPLTVTVALAADPVTARQPLTGASFSASTAQGPGPRPR